MKLNIQLFGGRGASSSSGLNIKNEQFKIIQKENPMLDDYHVGIRSVNDIRTWNEVLKLDDDSEGQFAWGDYTREDAERDFKKGTITIYSSKDIKNGTFVSTSRIQAEEYAGGSGSKVYEKTIPISDVAWINGDEGQYAKVKNRRKKNMNLNIQLFGGRGSSSSIAKISRYENLINKRDNMKYSITLGKGIDLFERNKNTTSITSYKMSELNEVMKNIDETIVEVQQGSYEKRINQLKDIGFNVISKTKSDGEKTANILVHIKRRR